MFKVWFETIVTYSPQIHGCFLEPVQLLLSYGALLHPLYILCFICAFSGGLDPLPFLSRMPSHRKPFLALYTRYLVCDIDTNPSTLMKTLPTFIFRCSQFSETTQWLTSSGAFSVGEKQRKMCVWLCDDQESITCYLSVPMKELTGDGVGEGQLCKAVKVVAAASWWGREGECSRHEGGRGQNYLKKPWRMKKKHLKKLSSEMSFPSLSYSFHLSGESTCLSCDLSATVTQFSICY